MGVKELFELDYCVFYSWVGDQLPSLTSHVFCTKATNEKEAKDAFLKHMKKDMSRAFLEKATLYDEKTDKGDVEIDGIAEMPYDPNKWNPNQVIQTMADEWKLDWEEAYRIHLALLTSKELDEDGHGPDTLEEYGHDVDKEGFIPMPNEDDIEAAKEWIAKRH